MSPGQLSKTGKIGKPGKPGKTGKAAASKGGGQRGKPRGFRRDRDCVTCKQRGLKCDLNRPQCLPCVQAGLACGGYPLRVVWAQQRRPSAREGRTSTAMTTAATTPTETATTAKIAEAADGSPRLSLSDSPDSSTASLSSLTLISHDGSEPWSETDQNSLFRRLAALCSHILMTEGAGEASSSQSDQYSHYDQYDQDERNERNERNDRNDQNSQHGQYKKLSPETARMLSDLCMFIQARLEGRELLAASNSGRSLKDHYDNDNHDHDDNAHTHTHTHAQAHNAAAESLDMVRRRLAALANVNRAIEAANPLAFLGIATFAVFEVCDTTFGEWQCHLHGARSVLDYHRCRSMADLHRLARCVPGLLDILARLVWFDICGAVVRGNADAGLIFDDWHREVLDDSFFRTIGCPADTCALYVDVAKARIVAQDPVRGCLRATEQVAKAGGEASRQQGRDRQRDGAGWDVCADVNRCAAALAVLGQLPVSGASTTSATTSAVASRLCEMLAATPPSSPFYIHMALGAYLAGMHACNEAHCRTVRQYWHNCSLAGISRYPGGLARCEERWRSVGLLAGPAATDVARSRG